MAILLLLYLQKFSRVPFYDSLHVQVPEQKGAVKIFEPLFTLKVLLSYVNLAMGIFIKIALWIAFSMRKQVWIQRQIVTAPDPGIHTYPKNKKKKW